MCYSAHTGIKRGQNARAADIPAEARLMLVQIVGKEPSYREVHGGPEYHGCGKRSLRGAFTPG